MGLQLSPRSQILQALSGAPGCELDELVEMKKSEPAMFPAEDAGLAGSVSTSSGRIHGEYAMNTFRLTRDRLFAWHQYASGAHRQTEYNACIICGYHEARRPWSAVVQWLKKEGFRPSKTEDGVVELCCRRGHSENDLYRLIAGRGAWV